MSNQLLSQYHACAVTLVYTRHKIYRLHSATRSFLILRHCRSGAENKWDLLWMSFYYFVYQPFSRSTKKGGSFQFTLESFGDGESIFFKSFSFFCLFCFQSFSVNSALFCSTCSAQLELHKHLWRKDITHAKQFGALIHAAYWIFIIHFFPSYPWDIVHIHLMSVFIYGLHKLPRTLCAFPTCFGFIPSKSIGLNSLLR